MDCDNSRSEVDDEEGLTLSRSSLALRERIEVSTRAILIVDAHERYPSPLLGTATRYYAAERGVARQVASRTPRKRRDRRRPAQKAVG